jgi:hypothetical protein
MALLAPSWCSVLVFRFQIHLFIIQLMAAPVIIMDSICVVFKFQIGNAPITTAVISEVRQLRSLASDVRRISDVQAVLKQFLQ